MLFIKQQKFFLDLVQSLSPSNNVEDKNLSNLINQIFIVLQPIEKCFTGEISKSAVPRKKGIVEKLFTVILFF